MSGKNRSNTRWLVQKLVLLVLACAVFVGFFVSDFILHKSYLPELKKPTVYEMPEKSVKMKFVDLSSWNEVTDWSMVKASGIDGVILRIARYNLGVDPKFDAYYNAAKEQGLYVGCYYFMNAQTVEQARQDAEYVVGLLKEGEYQLDLPVFYDVEDDGTNGNTVSHLSSKTLTEIITAFCEKMLENNFYAGYYSNLNFASGEFYPKDLLKYPFWLAAWERDIKGDEYKNLTIWQCTEQGTVPGILGYCDVDWCFVDFEGFIIKKGYNKFD